MVVKGTERRDRKMDQRQVLARLLRRLAETVEHYSVEELESLLSGRAEHSILNGLDRVRRKRDSASTYPSESRQNEFREIVTQLRGLTSRNEGLSLLRELNLSKKDLERIARLMDLPVLREDDAEKLRHKIVEQSIGATLNSQAIRGA
jgi:hypothetical protein